MAVIFNGVDALNVPSAASDVLAVLGILNVASTPAPMGVPVATAVPAGTVAAVPAVEIQKNAFLLPPLNTRSVLPLLGRLTDVLDVDVTDIAIVLFCADMSD